MTISPAFISNQIFLCLAYTRHEYATFVGLKTHVVNARVPPPGRDHPVFDTLKFYTTDMRFELQLRVPKVETC